MIQTRVPRNRRTRTNGFVLLDALIAILIFSFGILGLVAVQANATRLGGDAKYRTDAALQADRLIAQMWMASTITFVADFTGSAGSGGASYLAWVNELDCSTAKATSNCLPGVSANKPTVAVTSAGLVTITVFWQGPNDTSPHQFVVITQVDRT